MSITHLSSKGQIIIPKALRDAHGWESGQSFEIEETDEGVILKPIKAFAATKIEDVSGCLKSEGNKKSLEDMKEAIKKGIKKRHDRGRY